MRTARTISTLLIASFAAVGQSEAETTAHIRCPYEPPLDSRSDFDIRRVRERDVFPLLPDQASVLGSTALTTAWRRRFAEGNPQTLLVGGRLGQRSLHPALHLSGRVEIPWTYRDDFDRPRYEAGIGYRSISGIVGGYVHLGIGVRLNVSHGGNGALFASLRPYEVDPDDNEILRLTQEVRIALAGCRAPFVHVSLEQRNTAGIDVLSTSYTIPAKVTLGLFPWKFGAAVGLDFFYEPAQDGADEEDGKVLIRFRAAAEWLGRANSRLGAAAETLIRRPDESPEDGWTLQVYGQWLL